MKHPVMYQCSTSTKCTKELQNLHIKMRFGFLPPFRSLTLANSKDTPNILQHGEQLIPNNSGCKAM